ncbi:MAG: phosphoribosylanthranilate isomerase [Chloroflexota bacterium]
MSALKVKICGLRDLANARAAVEAGADFVGFIFAPTRRYVAPDVVATICRELPSSVQKVGLFVNERAEVIRTIIQDCRLDYAQLCGDETPEFCRTLGVPAVKSLKVRGPEVLDEVARYAGVVAWCNLDGFQPDQHGGTGTRFDWELAGPVARRFTVMVAGGLTPENVTEAIAVARPWGVDVSSGVETGGQKDPEKIARFVKAAKSFPHPLPPLPAAGGGS